MTQFYKQHVLDNGLVLLAEPIEAVQSVAFAFLLPAGASRFPLAQCGVANVMLDWIFRGAGERDNRQLNDALDDLGLHRVGSVGSSHIVVGAALEASNLSTALDLYADVLLRPRLEDEPFEPARQLVMDEIHGLEDDPRQKVMLKLRESFYPSPLGMSTLGDLDALTGLSPQVARDLWQSHVDLGDTVVAVAGKFDYEQVKAQIEGLFADQSANTQTALTLGHPGEKELHIPHDGAQMHIGLMTPTVKISDPDYYPARIAVSILSGGMSSRLFTEVREKRGLCYAISARYHGLKEAAGVTCYAGTTPDKAQETLDVTLQEFRNLGVGITEDELDRAKVGLKASLIMQSESTSSRAGALASDFYLLNRVRSLDEIKQAIDHVTVSSVTDFLTKNPLQDFTRVTIGPTTLSSTAS